MKRLTKFIQKEKIALAIAFMVLMSIFFIALYPSDSRVEIGDPMSYHILAQNIVKFGTFGERYHSSTPGLHLFHSMPSGEKIATTYRPPGYPAFLALIYIISENYYFIVTIQSILAIFAIFLFYSLTRRYFGDKIALISTGLYSLLPAFYQLNASFFSESTTQSMLIISLYLYLTGNKLWLNIILPALLFSWVVLSRPTYAAYLPIIALFVGVSYLREKSINKRLLLFFVFIMLPIVIWSIRCSIVTKKPVFISSTSGINFFLSNNPYVLNGRASTWPSQDYLVQNNINVFRNDYNDAELNQQMTKSGLKWIIANPGLFLRLVPNRIVYFFAPITTSFIPKGLSGHLPKFCMGLITIWSILLCYTFLFFSLVGVWFFPRKKILLWSLPYLAVIAVTYPENRYFFPFVLPITILAAYGILHIKKIKQATYILPVVIFAVYWQLNYFAPELYRQAALTSSHMLSYINARNFVQKNPDKIFLTDSITVSSDRRLLTKKPPVDNEESFVLISKNIIVSEAEILEKINRGQIFTDVVNPFSGLDKEVYPTITDQNNLIYEYFDKKSIFKISDRSPVNLTTGLSGSYSNRPSQLFFIRDFTLERGNKYLIEARFSSRGKVVICSPKNEFCIDLFNVVDIDNFSVSTVIDTDQLPSQFSTYKLGIVNKVNYPSPNNYDVLYTGSRAYFTENGVSVNCSEIN
jgi:4-amino-4-deoxy-L-arabinose transferase-like glycosyltransferase